MIINIILDELIAISNVEEAPQAVFTKAKKHGVENASNLQWTGSIARYSPFHDEIPTYASNLTCALISLSLFFRLLSVCIASRRVVAVILSLFLFPVVRWPMCTFFPSKCISALLGKSNACDLKTYTHTHTHARTQSEMRTARITTVRLLNAALFTEQIIGTISEVILSQQHGPSFVFFHLK